MAPISILKIDSVAWFGHLPLRQCSMGAQGVYVNLLALAAASPDPNVILRPSKQPMEGKDIAHLLQVPWFTYSGWLKELVDAGLVTVRDDAAICLEKINASGGGAAVARRKALTKVPSTESEELWRQFWDLYPKKKAIAPARRAFFRLLAEGHGPKIIEGLKKQLPELLQREPQYRPYPATWLNGRSFEDEPDVPQAQAAPAWEPQFPIL
jgi:hypothetical protein